MIVYNETKTKILSSYDLEKGYLKSDKLFIKHHNAVDAVEGVYSYEVVAKYPNGGRTVKKVWKVEPVEAKESYDEYQDIKVYIPYSDSELASRKIDKLKKKLEETDYQAIKYAEGWISEEEYSEMRLQRQGWREEINELEILRGDK